MLKYRRKPDLFLYILPFCLAKISSFVFLSHASGVRRKNKKKWQKKLFRLAKFVGCLQPDVDFCVLLVFVIIFFYLYFPRVAK